MLLRASAKRRAEFGVRADPSGEECRRGLLDSATRRAALRGTQSYPSSVPHISTEQANSRRTAGSASPRPRRAPCDDNSPAYPGRRPAIVRLIHEIAEGGGASRRSTTLHRRFHDSPDASRSSRGRREDAVRPARLPPSLRLFTPRSRLIGVLVSDRRPKAKASATPVETALRLLRDAGCTEAPVSPATGTCAFFYAIQPAIRFIEFCSTPTASTPGSTMPAPIAMIDELVVRPETQVGRRRRCADD